MLIGDGCWSDKLLRRANLQRVMMPATELRGNSNLAGTLHILVTYVYLIAVREKGSAAGSSYICRQIFDYTGLKTLSKRLQPSLDTFVEINDSYTNFCHICDSQKLEIF